MTSGHMAREANPRVPASGLGKHEGHRAGGFEQKLAGSPIHLCCSPTSRVTELALTVERLQNQNLEKDRLNKALTEKLEALVRCRAGRGHRPDPWTQAEGWVAWANPKHPTQTQFHPLIN